MMRLILSVLAAFVPATGAVLSAQDTTPTPTFDAATAKAVIIDTTTAPSFGVYEPWTPQRRRATGDKCEGDWIEAVLYVTKQNGLTISERTGLRNGKLPVDFGMSISPASSAGLSMASYCQVGTDPARAPDMVGTNANGVICLFDDADFDAQNRAKVYLFGQVNRVSFGAGGSPSVTITSVDFVDTVPNEDGTSAGAGQVVSTSTPVVLSVDSTCDGLSNSALAVGGHEFYAIGVEGTVSSPSPSPLDSIYDQASYEPLSTRDYELTFTPTQADEPFRIRVWSFGNCGLISCDWNGMAFYDVIGGPAIIRFPLAVWGEVTYYAFGVQHMSSFVTVRTSTRTEVGYSLSSSLIIPTVEDSGTSSEGPTFGAPTRHAAPLFRLDPSQVPPEVLAAVPYLP